ncbi:hypothetical protein OSB04_012030 [Centaurea solstitialis]|uniref:Mevalonate kinase n=1 Tax=Centaurea solstitialis TaxID=347529 RepID=A0AA38TNQ0_9ASTR|nr:hypothetical protein OSB04_012030 [Centaurea solstitialis]
MEVRARAPGKIILAGEHAVVHGSAAVAASIALYTSVSLRFPSPSDNDDTLTLHLMDVGLDFSWPVGRIKAVLPASVNSIASSPTTCSPETVKLLATLVEEHTIPQEKSGIASGVIAFLWLYTSIQGSKPATVTVSSELPLGSGLGSSAAFCVSISGALLALSDSVKVESSQDGWVVFGEKEQQLANKWAFEGEKIIHGKPSGIDNSVSTFGNLIKFKSGALTCIKSNMILKMLITNTNVGRNTKALVAGVSERKIRHPDAMSSVFTAVDSISNELASIIQSSDDHDDDLEKEQRVEELMEMNQGLLQCMGVSHASIETVLRTTLKYKLTSKLTGAGGGGCVLTLLPTLLSATVIDKVIEELEQCGFQCFIAEIGGNGLEICFNDEEDNLLQGINSFRQSRNLIALSKNDNAGCMADEIAEALEDKDCSTMAGPSTTTTTSATQPRYANYPDVVKKCDIDINTTADGVILPVCVPKRVPTLVLTNYTQSSYASYLNNSRYTGVGIGKEKDWVVVVLTTDAPSGTFSNVAAPRQSTVVRASQGLVVLMAVWFGIW